LKEADEFHGKVSLNISNNEKKHSGSDESIGEYNGELIQKANEPGLIQVKSRQTTRSNDTQMIDLSDNE